MSTAPATPKILPVPIATEPVQGGASFFGAGSVVGGDAVLSYGFGDVRQIGRGADQHGDEAGIDDAERRSVVQPGIVPAESAKMLHQP